MDWTNPSTLLPTFSHLNYQPTPYDFQANDIVKYYLLNESESEVVYNRAVSENVTDISLIDTSKMFAFIAHFPGSRNIDNLDEVWFSLLNFNGI